MFNYERRLETESIKVPAAIHPASDIHCLTGKQELEVQEFIREVSNWDHAQSASGK